MTDNQSNPHLDRVPVFQSESPEADQMAAFKLETGNKNYRTSKLTYVSLFILLVAFPLQTLVSGDPTIMLKSLNEGSRMVLLIGTVVMLWMVFLMLYVSLYRENTGLAGIGFKRIRGLDFVWAFSFLLGANLILAGLAWSMAKFGLEIPGEVSLLIPEDTFGRIVWVVVSFTAGFCEESAFRGYLMTRIRILGRCPNWVLPVIISSLVFGSLHAYQGLPGIIIISVYGAMFSLLYIRTGTIWPAIIAHFFQDFSALFIPQ